MGSIPLDNGESVYTHDGTAAADPQAAIAALASSVATLMGNRERFDYTWANATERGAQTGMLTGSRGYQEDTKTEYIYDPTWRLAVPYIEFSATSQTLSGGGGYEAQTGWSVDATRSTDTTMVTVSGGTFTFVRAGLYSISVVGAIGAGGVATSFQAITSDTPAATILMISDYIQGVTGFTVPYRITADNTPLYLWVANITGSIGVRRVRITRTG